MTKRARKPVSASPLLGVMLLIAIAVALWLAWRYHVSPIAAPPISPEISASGDVAKAPTLLSADRIDPSNEGHLVSVSGNVKALKAARDAQLGVNANAEAIALLRRVEMLQWREHCVDSNCDYALTWSEQPIDSDAFHERKGHENSARFPIRSERFVADEVRLGAFKLDTRLAAQLIDAAQAIAYPVQAKQLPPNLAATFRERDGVLYAGADADTPSAGDLRVGYRIVVVNQQRVAGIQHGDRLAAGAASD